MTLHLVDKSFPNRDGSVSALTGVSFHVEPGELLCIVGPSGCGKSTLLKLIAGLVQPTAGTIHFERGADAPRIALVFQDDSLMPWLTLTDNVAFGLEMQGVAKAERERRAGAFLDQIGLSPFGRRYPHELSGGMRQRAAIARALLTQPQILLLDEPFSALDSQSKLLLQEELLRLWQLHRQTIVFVTHDIEEAIRLGDRILVMSGRPGRIRENLPIPLGPQPLGRHHRLRDTDQAELRELKWHIWKIIEEEVRQSLHLSH